MIGIWHIEHPYVVGTLRQVKYALVSSQVGEQVKKRDECPMIPLSRKLG